VDMLTERVNQALGIAAAPALAPATKQ